MTEDEALTLEAMKYAASMGHGGMVKEMFAPFTIKSTLAQPAQQPQVRTGNCLLCGVCASEGHKIQAKRPWVGLTDDEVYKIAFALEGEHWRKIAEAIEAKLKEKNT